MVKIILDKETAKKVVGGFCKKYKMSARQLAHRSGVDPHSVWKYANGLCGATEKNTWRLLIFMYRYIFGKEKLKELLNECN